VIVGKDYYFFFAREIEVEDIVIAEVFSIASLAEGVLTVCFEGIVRADYPVFCNEPGTSETV
jgi:hypothetical protein